MLFVYYDTEYEIHTYCPHCGSENTVIRIHRDGLFEFDRCNECGFIEKKRFNRNNFAR